MDIQQSLGSIARINSALHSDMSRLAASMEELVNLLQKKGEDDEMETRCRQTSEAGDWVLDGADRA